MIDPDLFWSKVDIGALDACWPSLSALARDYGVSRRTVRLAIEGTTYAWSDGR